MLEPIFQRIFSIQVSQVSFKQVLLNLRGKQPHPIRTFTFPTRDEHSIHHFAAPWVRLGSGSNTPPIKGTITRFFGGGR